MVIDTETFSKSILSNKDSISSGVDIGTPDLPISPEDISSSESYPICVGRSKATERPLTPLSNKDKYLSFDSDTDENPAYCRIVHNLLRYISL